MAKIYLFDDVQVDLGNFRVLKAGKALPLEPKALNVLVFLIEQRGRLVEKRELLDAVWGDAFVTENVLSRAVAQLRKAVADDAKEARYIETVPTRGYRFLAEVKVEADGDSQPSTGMAVLPTSVSSGVLDQRLSRRLPHYALSAIALLAAIGVVVAGIAIFRSRPAPAHLQILREIQLTSCEGLCMYPTPSPDGNSMAYSADHGQGFEIFVRQLMVGGQEFQITSDGGQNMQPAWSPDGKFIAYTSRRQGLWLVPAFGGPTKKLTDFGSHPAWSRDGQFIVFQSGALNDIDAASNGVFPPSTIWIMHPDGTGIRQITQAGKPEGGHGTPSWSPDGKHIAFVAYQYGISNLWSISTEGTGLLKVARQSAYYFYDPVYSPDGKSLVYGEMDGGNYRLWQIAVSPVTSAPLAEPQEITNSGETFLKHLAFSNDGKKLVYAALTDTSGLYSIVVPPSNGPISEPHSLIKATGCRITFPAFSPDGSRIAFAGCIGRSGVNTQISVMNSDGSSIQQLTVEPDSGNEPNWYPDGRHIGFFSQRALLSLDTQTREQKHVTDFSSPPGRFAISPDGTQLAINPAAGGTVNIWLMDLRTKAVKQITFDKELLGFPSWSPDGRFLAAEQQRGADTNVVVLPSSGGMVTQLTFDHGNNWPTGWSPDGDKIIFVKQQQDGIWNIWSVSRSTKTEKQLTHYAGLNTFVRYATMSPRGNQIAYEYTETSGNIWMLQFK